MADNRKYVQSQAFTLAGAGCIIGATTITLTSMLQIDGTTEITMSDFGTKGFATIEPGNGTQEEQISFTGITQNSNGTATLTGVSNVLMVSPYTETSGAAISHPGGVVLVISNTSGFYNGFANKNDDETITGLWDFPSGTNNPTIGNGSYVAPTANTQIATKKYVDDVAVAGAPDANTTTKGIVQIATQAQVDAGTATGSTGASLTPTPALLRSRLLSDYVADTGTANAYAIAPSPAISAYAAGQIFTFKAANANTGASTLAVNGLTAKNLLINGTLTPSAGYIKANALVQVQYDGTSFQILSVSGKAQLSQSGAEIYGASSGGTDTYAITVSPTPVAYAAGQVFRFLADVANTGAASLNVNSLGALSILRADGSALADGDIAANQIVEVVVYDGSTAKLLSPVANAPKYANGVNTSWTMATASGTLTIAHGLGRAPRMVRITAMIDGSGSFGSYNGTTQSITGYYGSSSIGASNGSMVNLTSPGASPHSQVGIVSVDATNISIAFTRSGTNGTETINMMWEAQA